MNPIFEEAFRTGVVRTREGEEIKYEANISARLCDVLTEEVARLERPEVLEVGMAFGTSSVHLADGIRQAKGTRLTAIDPFQTPDWRAIGIANLERAGHADLLEMIEVSSHLALPELVRSGRKFDFVFVDGWHSFDYTFVDFFYCDLLLKQGGRIGFHDVGWPAVSKVLRFIEQHKDYRLARSVPSGRPYWRQARRSIYRRVRGLIDGARISLRSGMVSEPVSYDEECRVYEKLGDRQVPADAHRPF